MKKYLWAGIAVLFVSANASGFKDLDSESNSFLSDLRKSAGDELDLDDEEETKVESSMQAGTSSVEKDNLDEPAASEEKPAQEDRTEIIRKKAVDEAKKAEAERIEREEMLNQISAKKEELKKAKEAEAKRAIEQREVEAYEKKRVEKLLQEEKEQAELEKKQLAEKEAVEQEKLAQTEAEQKEAAIVKSDSQDVVDINITREQKEAKDAADIAYWEAVQEMRKAE